VPILPAGHFANWAFWYSSGGYFISSSFMRSLPTGFSSMMKTYMPYINKGWDLLKPKSTYNESLEDNNPYEGKLYNVCSCFPY
jgi:hypothetical protein